MSNLTDEQRRKIEENRQKALTKRSEEQKRRMEENRQKALAIRAAKSPQKVPLGQVTQSVIPPNPQIFSGTGPSNLNNVPRAGCGYSGSISNRSTGTSGLIKQLNRESINAVNRTSVNIDNTSCTGHGYLKESHNVSPPRKDSLTAANSFYGHSKSNVNTGTSSGSSFLSVDKSNMNSYHKSGIHSLSVNPSTSVQGSSLCQSSAFGLNHQRDQSQTSLQTKSYTQSSGSKSGLYSSEEAAKLVANSPPKKQWSGPVTKGSCVLVSRERFEVNIAYCAPLVAVFKNMNTKQYDPHSKLWSFHLQEYETFMKQIRPIDEVMIGALPRCVLQCFAEHIRGNVKARHIPEADLDCVDRVLSDTLLPFQREGVNFAIWRQGRVLIADDMGLGKTLQAICIASYYREEWPVLIVVPSSVRFAWREQLLRWVPSLDPQEINVVVTGKVCCTTGQVVIISYDLMNRQKQVLLAKDFQVVIMDESHNLKNIKTARTQAAMPILKNARRVLLLSGTPALSRPSELFVQISAIDSRTFNKFHEFGVRYCDGKQLPWGWDFSGSSNLQELQVILEERIMIRRLKKDVIKQLPAKQRQMLVLDPSSVKVNKVMKTSHKLVDKMKGMERRGALLEYFHETCSAKLPAVKDYVLDLLDSDHKFLLFAHHQSMLDELEKVINKNYKSIRIDGRTNPEQRNYFCNKFQNNPDIKVAILSITAANAGLNLTAASLVVFAELFWNPGILVQAEDRAHRIGQEDSVIVQYLVATGTADDYIWPLVQKKLDVLSKAGLSKDNFSEADTTQVQNQDRKTRDIMSYFEESFFEDDMPEGWSDCGSSQDSDNVVEKLQPVKMESSPIKKVRSPLRQKSMLAYYQKSPEKYIPPPEPLRTPEVIIPLDQKCGTRVVHLRRRNGKVVEDCDIYIGRNQFQGGWKLSKSDWANPYSAKDCGSNEEACRRYEKYLKHERPDLMARLPELHGKVLGCWCKPNACHGDVLVRLLKEMQEDQESGKIPAKKCLFSYFPSTSSQDKVKAEIKTEIKTEILEEEDPTKEMAEATQALLSSDWLDEMDEFWEEDDPSAPWPKRQKLGP